MISKFTLSLLVVTFYAAFPWSGRAESPSPASAANKTMLDADTLYRQAVELARKGDRDGALVKATDALKLQPDSVLILALRGDLYAKKHSWIEAGQDFNAILKINPNNALAKFDLAEILLMQKQYETARAGFLPLVNSPEFGDLAAYKVYLCDLFGQDQLAATKELAVFNKASKNASYYYANAAHSLYVGDVEQARKWINSGIKIYPPDKTHVYLSTLKDLGYLPLPPKLEK